MKESLSSFSIHRIDIVASTFFLVVATALAWLADSSLGFGLDQISYNLSTEELVTAMDQDRSLESEFGSALRQSFAFMHALGQRATGNPENSYRLILVLAAFFYLLAMYILMAHILENRWIAVLVAVLSIVQRYTIGTSFWGMGEFQSILPRIVVLPVFPLAWWLFERHIGSRRVLLAFVVVALGFSLHLSAVYFYAILLMTYGLYVISSRSWSSFLDLAMATAFLAFALKTIPNPSWSPLIEQSNPVALTMAVIGFSLVLATTRLNLSPPWSVATTLYLAISFVWLLGGSSLESIVGVSQNDTISAAASDPPTSTTVLESTNQALYARFGWMLFPISMATLGFAAFNCFLLAGPALYEFGRRWRLRVEVRETIVGYYLISTIFVSLGLTALIQLYCWITGQPDMILELFRAFRYIFLPLYIYLGFFLQRVWKESRAKKSIPRQVSISLLVLALLISPRQALAALPDGLKLKIRSFAESSGSLNPADPSQQRYLFQLLATGPEIREARQRYRDFLELSNWVERSTAENSVFLTTDYSFIFHARRDIKVSYQQGAGSARSVSNLIGHRAWHDAYQSISSAFASRSPDRILAAAREYGADYIVTSAEQPKLPVETVYANRSYSLYLATP